MFLFSALFRRAFCSPNEQIYFISEDEYNQKLPAEIEELGDVSKYKKPGPRFADGSINWQCPCMASGSLVAHRCGHFFRKLYVCMNEMEGEDATVKCPSQFIDWASCMQNLSEERRLQMRQNLLDENEKKAEK